MTSFDPGFEIGFPKPSLENPALFSRYADDVAARLRSRYGPGGGYRVSVEKRETDPKKRRWEVKVFGGLFSGACIYIKPIAVAPHRAKVEVRWNSRLQDVLAKGFAFVSVPIFFLVFLALALKTRLGFALIVTVVLWFVWALAGSVVLLVIARLCAALFGNEFDEQRRSAMAQEVRAVSLPAQTE